MRNIEIIFEDFGVFSFLSFFNSVCDFARLNNHLNSKSNKKKLKNKINLFICFKVDFEI